jgi:hypothetical protein
MPAGPPGPTSTSRPLHRRLLRTRLRLGAGGLDDGCDPHGHGGHDLGGHHPRGPDDPGQGDPGLAERLQTAMARLPPPLGGPPANPWMWTGPPGSCRPPQRLALAVPDRGGVGPGCARPLAGCAAHQLWHRLDGGPTDPANLVRLCRAHHRAVHEGGWRRQRQPDGRPTASPSHRQHRHRRQPTAA